MEVMDRARAAHGVFPSEWYCVMFMDVHNVFNTANWTRIVCVLDKTGGRAYVRNAMKNYLTNRGIKCGAIRMVRKTNVGVPQGSILGLAQLPEGFILIGFVFGKSTSVEFFHCFGKLSLI